MPVQVIGFPPGVFPDTQRLTPDANQSVQDSWPGAQSVITFQGSEKWLLSLTMGDLTGDARADVMAFCVKLRISRNVFLCVNHTAPQRGALSGSPVVSDTSGDLLRISGASTSVDSWVRNGDFISVNCELKMVTSDAGADGSGIAVFPIWPPFRQTPTLGDVVVVSSPCGVFRATQAVPLNTDPPGYRTNVVIEAMEHINSSYVSELV